MGKSSQLLCTNAGLCFALLLGLGFFGIAGWMPPIPPGRTAAEIARMFIDDQMRIRIGMTVLSFGASLYWVFGAAISTQMKRVEGEHHPYSYVQMMSSAVTGLAIIMVSYCWLGLCYRPQDIPPATIQLLNDICWFIFIGVFAPAVIQNLALGLCILSDKSPTPVFPRWVGFANIWLAITFLPGALLPFFKSGAFAWNGLIGFWLVAFCFFGWIAMMWWATRRAVLRQYAAT